MLLIGQLLLVTVDKCDVPSMLNRVSPAQVQFANRVSCDSNAGDTLQGLVTVGSLAPWQGARPPTVINGLGVVKNCKGKKRLVLDCRYVNAFVRYEHFAYEQLSDVTEYMQPDGWFVLTDARSGYHHVPMHPDSFEDLALELQGQLYVFTHLPFGLASACKVYTAVMSDVYKPLRLHSVCPISLMMHCLLLALGKVALPRSRPYVYCLQPWDSICLGTSAVLCLSSKESSWVE